ncbi:hypothetical protein IWZ01DRAFT_503949 [Phyllosticta capitalensis]
MDTGRPSLEATKTPTARVNGHPLRRGPSNTQFNIGPSNQIFPISKILQANVCATHSADVAVRQLAEWILTNDVWEPCIRGVHDEDALLIAFQNRLRIRPFSIFRFGLSRQNSRDWLSMQLFQRPYRSVDGGVLTVPPVRCPVLHLLAAHRLFAFGRRLLITAATSAADSFCPFPNPSSSRHIPRLTSPLIDPTAAVIVIVVVAESTRLPSVLGDGVVFHSQVVVVVNLGLAVSVAVPHVYDIMTVVGVYFDFFLFLFIVVVGGGRGWGWDNAIMTLLVGSRGIAHCIATGLSKMVRDTAGKDA